MTIGLRGRNLVLNNTATWSNMHIEFYPAKVSVFTGDNHSSGTWNRPIINPRQGIDLGRDTDITEFTAIPFQVDMTGIYGIHTQLHGGTGVLEGVTYLFQGMFPSQVRTQTFSTPTYRGCMAWDTPTSTP